MKKTILGILAATTILSTNISVMNSAHASEGASCSIHENVSRFNPTELSEFQKCVILKHEDKKSGIFGNLFWMNINGEIVSMQTKILRDAGSKNAAKAVIKETVTKTIIKQVVNPLNTQLSMDLEAVKAEKDQLSRDLIQAIADRDYARGNAITPLNDIITEALNGSAAATVQEALTTIYTAIGNLQSAESDLSELIGEIGSILPGLGTASDLESALNKLDDIVGTYNRKVAEITAFNTRIADTLYGNKQIAHGQYRTMNEDGSYTDRNHPAFSDFGESASLGTGDTPQEFVDSDNITNYQHTTRTYTPEGTDIPITVDRLSVNINGIEKFVEHVNGATALDNLLEEVYDQGYQNGYEDGYADGYKDGFNDGVASVR